MSTMTTTISAVNTIDTPDTIRTPDTPERFDVSGRTIIVTGGAGLLGREYGRALFDAGANVVLADIDGGRVASLATDLGATHRADADAAGANGAMDPASKKGKAIGVAVDVTDEASVAQLVRGTLTAFGRIDGLVNNAALDPKFDRGKSDQLAVTFENYPLELWNRALAVNLTGLFLCARAVAPSMLEQGRGVIVNVSSTYGMVGPDQRLYESDRPEAPREFKPVAYSVTKSGVIGFTRYLAAYWAGTGIRVNTLTPGGVLNGHPPEFVRRYSARTPLGRMADRGEYCGALLFLLSDASSYMTGSNLVVDGGWTAW
jgi:NAD(P)-dependent dehydrogenase (short-subunit alcohol dehydrogenase family)